MGSVSIDLHKKERDYKNLTLSDENVVKYLITYRSKIDVTYGANININMNQAGDVFEFNQEVIALYASLDMTTEDCRLTQKQSKLITLLYEGNTVSDVTDILNTDRVSVKEMLDRIICKIVEKNNEKWYYMMGHSGNIIKKDGLSDGK